MFISDEEFVSRLTSEENLVTRVGRPSPSAPDSSCPLPSPPDLDISSLLDILPSESGSPKSSKGEGSSFHQALEIIQKNAIQEEQIRPFIPGKRGPRGLHDSVRAAIGVTSGILGPTRAAELGDVSQSLPFAHQRGHNATNDVYTKTPKEELQNKIIRGHDIIVDKCFNRLLKTLDLLDDDKLSGVKRATELSVIGKNLSGIIASASNATKEHFVDGREQTVHFHIMRPEPALDADYPVIDVSSAPSEPEEPK